MLARGKPPLILVVVVGRDRALRGNGARFVDWGLWSRCEVLRETAVADAVADARQYLFLEQPELFDGVLDRDPVSGYAHLRTPCAHG